MALSPDQVAAGRQAAIECANAVNAVSTAVAAVAAGEQQDYRPYFASLYRSLHNGWAPISAAWPQLVELNRRSDNLVEISLPSQMDEGQPICFCDLNPEPPVWAWLVAAKLFQFVLSQTEHVGTATEAWWMWKQEYEPPDTDGPEGNLHAWGRINTDVINWILRPCKNLNAAIESSLPAKEADTSSQRWNSPTAARAAFLSLPWPIPKRPKGREEFHDRLRSDALGFVESVNWYRKSLEERLARVVDKIEYTWELSESDLQPFQPPEVPLIIAQYYPWADYQIYKAKAKGMFVKLLSIICKVLPKTRFLLGTVRNSLGMVCCVGPAGFDERFRKAGLVRLNSGEVEVIKSAILKYSDLCKSLIQFFERYYDRFIEQLPEHSSEHTRRETEAVGRAEQQNHHAIIDKPPDKGGEGDVLASPSESPPTGGPVKSSKGKTYKVIIGLVDEKQFRITMGPDEFVLKSNYTFFFGLFVSNIVKDVADARVEWGPLNRAADPTAEDVDARTSSNKTRRRLKSLNEKFNSCFGEGPPEDSRGDTNWIITDVGTGAYLNPRIKWKADPDIEKFYKGRKKGQDVDWDPGKMAGSFSDKRTDGDNR